MAYYWRAGKIPELQEVQAEDRREWLHVAEERSLPRGVRRLSTLAVALAVLVAGLLQDWLRLDWLFVVPILALAAVGTRIWDVVYRQPRARRWLREHLHAFRTDESHAEAVGR